MLLRAHWPQPVSPPEEFMLDLVYLIGAVGLFGLVALVAWGVERL